MKKLHVISFILVVIGGLNWLLVGLFAWDVGALFGGQENVVSRIIYVLVGLATISLIVNHKKECKECCGTTCSACSTPSSTPTPQA